MEADKRLRRSLEQRMSNTLGSPIQPNISSNNYMFRDKWDVLLRLPADLSAAGPLQDPFGNFYFMMGYSALNGKDILK